MIQKLKKKKIWIPFLIAAITASVVATQFFGEDDYLSVTAEKVQKRDIIHKINASGIIQPEEEVQITSMVSGWITEITVVEGDTVNPDQHLISIDQKQYQAAYDQAASQVKSSEANLKNIKPIIFIEVNPDRTVKSSKSLNQERMSDPSFRTAAEAAMRAVNNPDCSPLLLPEDKYNQWKEINFTFDFSWMFD